MCESWCVSHGVEVMVCESWCVSRERYLRMLSDVKYQQLQTSKANLGGQKALSYTIVYYNDSVYHIDSPLGTVLEQSRLSLTMTNQCTICCYCPIPSVCPRNTLSKGCLFLTWCIVVLSLGSLMSHPFSHTYSLNVVYPLVTLRGVPGEGLSVLM